MTENTVRNAILEVSQEYYCKLSLLLSNIKELNYEIDALAAQYVMDMEKLNEAMPLLDSTNFQEEVNEDEEEKSI